MQRRRKRYPYARMTRKRRRAQLRRRFLGTAVVAIFCVLGLVIGLRKLTGIGQGGPIELQADTNSVQWEGAPPIDVELLTPNEWSRPQTPLQQIHGIVIHYTANPGSTARQNRDYFEGLKDSHETKASSHFVIGLEGEVIQCIPSSEWAYASNDRNSDTLSIECCHPDESGKFNDATYRSMVELTGWLCHRFGLSSENVIRHYDVTGKLCPKYFVEHEDAWRQFLEDVQDYADSL